MYVNQNTGKISEGFFKNGDLHGPTRIITGKGQYSVGNFYEGKKDGKWEQHMTYGATV